MKQDNIKVTNEELARMIKAGFDHVDERFEQVDEKFNQIDKRFEQVDKRFDGLEKDVRDIGHKVNQIDKRFFSLEEDIYVTKKKQQDKLEERVTFIEGKLGIAAGR